MAEPSPFGSAFDNIMFSKQERMQRFGEGQTLAGGALISTAMKRLQEIRQRDPMAPPDRVLNELMNTPEGIKIFSRGGAEFDTLVKAVTASSKPQPQIVNQGANTALTSVAPADQAGGTPTATVISPPIGGDFSLNPGDTRFDRTGKPIATAPAKPMIVNVPGPYGTKRQRILTPNPDGSFDLTDPADTSGPITPPNAKRSNVINVPAQFQPVITEAANRYGVDEGFFTRLLHQESRFNPNAISPAGAEGIAQFMPATARQYGVNTRDPNSAIPGSAKMLSERLAARDGNYALAAMDYNWGSGNVDTWLKRGANPASIPAETKDYLRATLGSPDTVIQAMAPRAATLGVDPEKTPVGNRGKTMADAVFASGPVGGIINSWNKLVGPWAPNLTDTEVGNMQADIGIFQEQARDFYRSHGRTGIQEQKWINALAPDGGIWSGGPQANISLLKAMREDIARTQERDIAVLNDPNAPAEQQKDAYKRAFMGEHLLQQIGSRKDLDEAGERAKSFTSVSHPRRLLNVVKGGLDEAQTAVTGGVGDRQFFEAAKEKAQQGVIDAATLKNFTVDQIRELKSLLPPRK